MCMFCAAIPATAAIGAKLNAKQRAKRAEISQAGDDDENIQEKPVAVITVGLIVVLLIGSVVYHTHFNSWI
jgi:hypothetical protein